MSPTLVAIPTDRPSIHRYIVNQKRHIWNIISISTQAGLGLIQAFRKDFAIIERLISLLLLSILPTVQLVVMYKLYRFLLIIFLL